MGGLVRGAELAPDDLLDLALGAVTTMAWRRVASHQRTARAAAQSLPELLAPTR